MLELTGYLDAEGGAAVRTALEPLALRRGRDDDRCRERRCADALVELCGHALDTGVVPQRASQRSHVQVTTTLETLLDLAGAPGGEMEYAEVIAGATVQRLACDATATRVLLDPQSAVVDVGRSERVVPGSTRRALNVRDKGCRWPGCDRSASWTAAHHLVPGALAQRRPDGPAQPRAPVPSLPLVGARRRLAARVRRGWIGVGVAAAGPRAIAELIAPGCDALGAREVDAADPG